MIVPRLSVAALLLGAVAVAHADTAVEQADGEFSSRNWVEAAELYEQALEELEGEAYYRALGRQGEALRRAERFAEAAPLLRRLLEAEDAPANMRVDAGHRLGRALREDGKAEEAVEALRETLEVEGIRNTTFGDVAIRAGDILTFELQEYDEAIEMYEKVGRASELIGLSTGWARESDAAGRADYARALRDGPSTFWIGPYTTHVHDRKAQVYWVSGEDDPVGVMTLSGGAGEGEYEADARTLRSAEDYSIQVVRLTDLDPGTRYEYTVRAGDHEETGSFRTAPEPGSRERITFAVYGDTQDRPEFHRETAPVIAESEPEFILHTGDMVGSGDYWPHWKTQYFDPGRPALRDAPIWPSVGNHDGFRYYDQFFAEGTGLFHSFTYGNVEVFIVASYRGGGIREEQLAWVEEALASSEAEWKFVVTHYPMLSDRTHHWYNWGQEDYLPIFEEHGVDFVLTGHEHVYRRFLPIGAEGKNPIFHITSGGGASVLGDHGHDGDGPAYAPTPLTPVSVRALHFLHFEIEGDELVMEARLRDSTILDRLELTKSGGRMPEDVLAQSMTLETALNKVQAYGALQEQFGRRHYRMAPAQFEAVNSDSQEDATRTFDVRFENTFPEEAGEMRISPSEETDWSFEPTVFAGGEPIAFEAKASADLESPGDERLYVELLLKSQAERELVPETFRVLPAN